MRNMSLAESAAAQNIAFVMFIANITWMLIDTDRHFPNNNKES